MATLILTAVGTALGGPLGGAIGAAIGQAADQNLLFKPKGREGPRLDTLEVQTSTYGNQVPRIFGRMRVAGTVIWATDLKESRKKSGGGKGRPSVTTYSYSASFAVALSSRPILRVDRIWADGNLLRGAAGDFKVELGAFRLFTGDADQTADQFIASAEGAAMTPAYRGMAYALFEDLQLADYGNRIPSLTFEVVAEDGAVRIVDIAGDLSGGVLSGTGAEDVTGYAASGPSVAQAMEPLIDAFGLRLFPASEGLLLSGAVAAEGAIVANSLAGRVNGRAVTPSSASRQAAALVPQSLSLRYYEKERDYQAGLQRSRRPGAGRQHAQIDLPAVLPAAQARQLAGAKLATLWQGRSVLELVCGWRELERMPGSIVSVAGLPGLWSVETLEWEGMALKLFLRQAATASPGSLPASPGTAVREQDQPQGPTTLRLAELPGFGNEPETAPIAVAAAAGASSGWRRAALFVEEGDAIVGIGSTGAPATMGTSLTAPAAASPSLFDNRSVLDIALLSDGMELAGASDEALLRGANLCLLGEELLQFGQAVQIGPREYRLTRLLRGRRGTEWAMAGHSGGESFLLIEEASLVAVPAAHLRIGGTLSMLASGVGDLEPAEASQAIAGLALQPPSPVRLTIALDSAGDRTICWVRRSRAGWTWSDHVDAPLAEEFERYRLRVLAGETVLRSVETTDPEFLYSAEMAIADAAAGGSSLVVEVAQIGARGVSVPMTQAIAP